MAYLAEKHDIWGPFLVIAPASTLHNWQQEITRFVPGLKALPYWGNVKDRTILRKFWNRKSLRYDKDAPFHILVTSYQLVSLFAHSKALLSSKSGRSGRKVLSESQVAVHDLGRSSSHQVFFFSSMEDPSRFQLQEPSFAHWHAHSKLDD
jgi:SNF2 family DNA or RNA helicase